MVITMSQTHYINRYYINTVNNTQVHTNTETYAIVQNKCLKP